MARNKIDEPLTLDEIHRVTLDVLKKIQEICKAHQITYFVAYGSLIGAVRHKGFIPWDDDFDIMMLRPDYDRFCAICNESINGHGDYALMNPDNNKDYPFNISRFCDLRYRMVRDDNEPDAGMGIFIDIYPLDGMGNSIAFMEKVMEPLRDICFRFLSLAVSEKAFVKHHGLIKKMVRFPIWALTHLLGKHFFYKCCNWIASFYSLEKSKYIGCVVWDQLIYYPKEYFKKTIPILFEGLEVTIPQEYDKVLRVVYGDYMELPPAEQRHPTHAYKIYKR